jgi:hypothetical protein
MEPFHLDHDITLLCLKADSFPDGVMAAWNKLYSLLGTREGRHAFGISWSDSKGGIIYKAAVEESYAGEAEKLGCETHVAKKGAYSSIYIPDFPSDMQSFSRAFRELLTDSRLDPQGMCVEMYINDKEVRCMVRLDPAKASATKEASASATANPNYMALPKS